MKTSMWGSALNAICFGYTPASAGLPLSRAAVWPASSSIASLPVPETDW